MNTIERFLGTYEGYGSWHDSAGKSMTYKVTQTIGAIDGGFNIVFKHEFDDGSVVDAHFDMSWVGPFLFRVDTASAPIGNGYIFDDYCHYHLKVKEAFVEASYRVSSNTVEAFGSSSRNEDGNYIAWKETLRRTA